MPLHIVIGAQWGDEGKGRIVDWLASGADISARFNGGDNAGHTVNDGSRLYRLHLLPSGVIQPATRAVIGNGVVVNPLRLVQEMNELSSLGVDLSPQRVRISLSAHLITPAHIALDLAEEALRGSAAIGTTGRGIGPAYSEKVARQGLRTCDTLLPDFNELLIGKLASANLRLAGMSRDPLDIPEIVAEYMNAVKTLKPHLTDTAAELYAALKEGRMILAEGAQGALLDLDHGSYPFVTSSNTNAGAALTGLGLGLDAARNARLTGIAKAFQTRVGSGPFPTELDGALAERLRGSGGNAWDEFGTTTGRPRRVGWLDGVLLRQASRMNGFSDLAVTKLDILSGLEKVRLCVEHQRRHNTPGVTLEGVTPVYRDFPGWHEPLENIRRWQDLPRPARNYLEAIAEAAECPLSFVSVGPARDQLIAL